MSETNTIHLVRARGRTGWAFTFESGEAALNGKVTRRGESLASVLSLAAIVGLFIGIANGIRYLTRRFQIRNPLELDDFEMWVVGVAWLLVVLASIYLGILVGQLLSPLRLRVRSETNPDFDFDVVRSAAPSFGKCCYRVRNQNGEVEAVLVEQINGGNNVLAATDGQVMCVVSAQEPDLSNIDSANRLAPSSVAMAVVLAAAASCLALVLMLLPFWILSFRGGSAGTAEGCMRFWKRSGGGSAAQEFGQVAGAFRGNQLDRVVMTLRSPSQGDFRRALMTASIMFRDLSSVADQR